MPTYGFRCNRCDVSFEVLVLDRKQADCKRAIPSMKMANCPSCAGIVYERDYTGTRLNKRFIKSMATTAALVGNPTYDPVFERLSVDGGRNDRKVFTGGAAISKSEAAANIINSMVTFHKAIDCDCGFCCPKLIDPTEGELLQKEIDKSLASVMVRGDLSGRNLHKDARYMAETKERHSAFQQFLADPEPSIPNDND